MVKAVVARVETFSHGIFINEKMRNASFVVDVFYTNDLVLVLTPLTILSLKQVRVFLKTKLR